MTKIPGTAKAPKKKALSKAAGGRIKETGRPAGSPNNGNTYPRDQVAKFRVTEGYKETIKFIKELEGMSEADIILEALQLYAGRKAKTKQHIYYINRII